MVNNCGLAAVGALKNNLEFLLEDKESVTSEIREKFLTIIKMLLYIYTKIVLLVEKMKDRHNSLTVPFKGKNKKKQEADDVFIGYDAMDVIVKLTNIIQCEISFFWDPPVTEDTFVRY